MKLYSRRGQFILILLATLEDLGGQTASKADVTRYIEARGYINFTPELLTSYQSKNEPVWQTELAMARRDAVDRGGLKTLKQQDAWEISEKGRGLLRRIIERLKSGELDVNRFGFWSLSFRRRMGV